MKSFSEFKIEDYLNDLTSTKPSPGGGSAAGVVVALACSLIGKVAAISQAKKEDVDFSEDLEVSEFLMRSAMKLSNLDAEVYADVVNAYQIKVGSDDEKKERRSVIDAALAQAFDVPYQLLGVIKKGDELRVDLLSRCSGAITSDLDVAGNFFNGAKTSALHLAEGNLDYIKDENIKKELSKKLEVLS